MISCLKQTARQGSKAFLQMGIEAGEEMGTGVTTTNTLDTVIGPDTEAGEDMGTGPMTINIPSTVTGPDTEAGEDMGTGPMTTKIPSTASGPDTTKIRTRDGRVMIAPDEGDGQTTTKALNMEEGPNTEDGLDTEMIAKTDGTLHTPDTENADTTATADHATDTDAIRSTGQSMPVQDRSATQTKQHGSSSKQTSIHPDSPSSSPTITT
jgi:hypothetical protein